jgi:hypothetical protein
VGLERGPHRLVSTTEELLGRKGSGSGLESREYCRWDPSRWARGTLYPRKLVLTSSTNGGRSVDVVRSRTQATEFFQPHCGPVIDSASNINEYQDFPGKKWRPAHKADKLTAIYELMSGKCGSLDVSQTYRPTRPVARIAYLHLVRNRWPCLRGVSSLMLCCYCWWL